MRYQVRSMIGAARVPAAVALLGAMAVPGFAQIPTPPRPSLALRVNCNAGQTVSAALARAALTFTPVVITITGVCAETVVIRQDDVTLQGAAPGAGLTFPSTGPGSTLLSLDGARRVLLHQLTLTPSGRYRTALELNQGAQAVISLLTVDADGSGGVVVWDGSIAEMYGSQFRNGSTQVQVTGGRLNLGPNTLENGSTGIRVNRGGSLLGTELTIRGQSSAGIEVSENAAATLGVLEITGSQIGLRCDSGGMVLVSSSTRIADNRADGIFATEGSKVFVAGGAVIENNLNGVRAEGGSIVTTADVTIRNNTGSGISLADTSLARHIAGTPVITGNAAWGISCAPAPAVAQVMPPGLPAAEISGNGLGATNCPALGMVGRIP